MALDKERYSPLQTVIGEVSVDAALNWAQEKNMETVVVITHKLDQQAITAAAQSLKQINDKNNTQMRYVIIVYLFIFLLL